MRHTFPKGHTINPRNTIDDFWAKIIRGGESECWEWNSTLHKSGYGVFNIACKQYRAHRMVYELTRGEVPKGMFVCHKCDNRRCCNPNHLFIGTVQDNQQDMVNKGRQAKGEQVNTNKLTAEQVVEIRRLHSTGRYSLKQLESRYGIKNIGRITNRIIWRSIV